MTALVFKDGVVAHGGDSGGGGVVSMLGNVRGQGGEDVRGWVE